MSDWGFQSRLEQAYQSCLCSNLHVLIHSKIPAASSYMSTRRKGKKKTRTDKRVQGEKSKNKYSSLQSSSSMNDEWMEAGARKRTKSLSPRNNPVNSTVSVPARRRLLCQGVAETWRLAVGARRRQRRPYLGHVWEVARRGVQRASRHRPAARLPARARALSAARRNL